jgi:hypothetical protein
MRNHRRRDPSPAPAHISRRFALVLACGVLLTGGVGASALLAAPAQATACGTALASCTLTGTLTLTAGTLTLTTDSTLGWSAAVTAGICSRVVSWSSDPTVTATPTVT